MLLVSSITPSGRTWAIESARSTLPAARVIDASDVVGDRGTLADAFGVLGSPVRSPDLVDALASFRDAARVLACFRQTAEDAIVWFPGSVASAVADIRILALLAQSASGLQEGDDGGEVLDSFVAALDAGDVQWLVASPPEEWAVRSVHAEVAVGIACGLGIRGVAMCPMPRKVDGWPKSLRTSARLRAATVEQSLHPVPVRRARGGVAPAFDDVPAHREVPSVTQVGDRAWVWSVTLPGMSGTQVHAGTWASDVTYPTSHVVLHIDGRTVFRAVGTTLRRCVGVDAVATGDSLAITFEADDRHWPQGAENERG